MLVASFFIVAGLFGPARDAVCPAETGAPINAAIKNIDGNALRATFAKDSPFGYKLTETSYFTWKTDTVWSGRALATYEGRGEIIDVTIEDMIHQCNGSGDALLHTEGIRDPALRRRHTDVPVITKQRGLLDIPAVFVEPWRDPFDNPRIVMWVKDRCRVTASGRIRAHGSLVILFETFDWVALEQLCAAR